MARNKKKLRYYYWLTVEFTKKNARFLLISFMISLISIVAVISVAPYVMGFAATKHIVVGIPGEYQISTLPDDIMNKVSTGLVYIDEEGNIVPVLADSWEQIDNGKEYVFNLKQNLAWSNGEPFTVEDINYSFQDVEIVKEGEYRIRFKLQKPLQIFPTYLTQPIVKGRLIGVAGRYSVDRVKTSFGIVEEIGLRPNREGLPRYTYKFYQSDTAMMNAYKLGEITEMSINKKSVADIFQTWNNTNIDQTVDYGKLFTLFFNMDKPLLQEKDIRDAIAMSIDRSIYSEIGELASGPIPPISWAHNPNLTTFRYNPDLAERLVSKFTEGSGEAKLRIHASFEHLDNAETIAQSLRDVGFTIDVETITFGQPHDFDMLLAYWLVPLDPDQYYYWHSTQEEGNITNYKNVKIDKLLEDGRDKFNIGERRDIYSNFQETLVNDSPAVFLYYPYNYAIKRK